MPPRKSNVSVVSNGAEEGGDGTPAKAPKDGMSVEDLSLPKSMIARLAKGVLPANTQIQKDALLALHKSATVFVSYIASNSNEFAANAGKKTIMPQDVLAAMKDCEFESFKPRLEAELQRYTEMQCDKRNTYRRKVKEEKAAAAPKDDGDTTIEGEATAGANGATTNGHANGEEVDRPTKKLKGDDGAAVAPDADSMDDEDDDGQEDQQEDGDDQPDDEEDDAEEDEDDDDDDNPSPEDEVDESRAMQVDEALDDPGSESD
ncbi:uncharacterized protein LTR77_009633 [Saxophila tyrrhenica]|uniref:DNA polymerase epsilon subunit D n=1 Tax=Saxophila tyrrhenica TaxID=1690608 RepID=A0AAV9NY64_9PEZI|nr:hypothetical protein LTR77_009633 [Saxophila tyrrhenica]